MAKKSKEQARAARPRNKKGMTEGDAEAAPVAPSVPRVSNMRLKVFWSHVQLIRAPALIAN